MYYFIQQGNIKESVKTFIKTFQINTILFLNFVFLGFFNEIWIIVSTTNIKQHNYFSTLIIRNLYKSTESAY